MRTILCIVLLAAGLAADEKPASKPAPGVVTKEALESRIRDLQTQKDQAIANANALTGAIQDCQFWLDQIRASEEKAAKTAGKAEQKPAPR